LEVLYSDPILSIRLFADVILEVFFTVLLRVIDKEGVLFLVVAVSEDAQGEAEDNNPLITLQNEEIFIYSSEGDFSKILFSKYYRREEQEKDLDI